MIKQKIKLIIKEINLVLKNIDAYQVNLFLNEVLNAKTIVVSGAGRMGIAARGFAMRLGHLGLKAYTVGDSTLPSIRKKDLLIVCSGSGETQTIYDLVLIGKQHGARIVLISTYIDHNKSRMAKIADTILVINAPTKIKQINGFVSIQPMTTLNEQCLTIFFDALVLMLMEKLNETHETMWKRHSNLE